MSQQQTEKRSYKNTLNLPKTSFAMKANLVQNEPASQKRWTQMKLYERLRQERSEAPRYTFHDGPPYANGSIHLGHLLNKVLKDIVVRTRTMMGFDVPYVPGWDCHGLPIEHKVVQDLRASRAGSSSSPAASGGGDGVASASGAGDGPARFDPVFIRRKCKAYVEKYVKLQSSQMQRLLTLGDYDHPYITMLPEYEAAELAVLADLLERGIVYRGKKPVHWSIENQTALADAELEYYDREDTSVYVLFELQPTAADALRASGASHLMIWTTTPWTLPANLAVAVHPDYEYGVYEVDGRRVVLAVDLAAKVLQLNGGAAGEPLKTLRGSDLVGVEYRHPFIDRTGRIVPADYVTLEDGTGLVHTAPGHGVEDYQTGLREGLDIYCPVRDDGTFDDTAPDWLRGKSVWEGNDLVVEHLKQSGHLFHAHRFMHSYPHDWRGKTPVIFRATEQWFIDVDKPYSVSEGSDHASMRSRAIGHVENLVKFYPEWGRNRMRGMLESRPDWCISRQRSWGLPIPAFYPPEGETGEPLLTPASVRAVAKLVAEKGSDVWFAAEPQDLLAHYDPASDPDAPDWIRRSGLSRSALRKGADTLDVWVDSGSSWNSVIRARFGDAAFPADLYVEGSDQHRGWFQSSLLLAIGAAGQAPFKAILTHGFMVDKDGKKMSKSLGNTLEVEDLLKNYGADVCRWWVSSLNTDNDIKVDESYFKHAGEEYRKVRNTIRFLLSNLYDFNTNPAAQSDVHAFTAEDGNTIDGWALGELDRLITDVVACYEHFQFRKAHELLFNFCNDTMSAVYLAATKDRLYCDPADGLRRRRTQTAMFHITDALIRLLAPVLPHTADEAWRALYGEDPATTPAESIHLAEFPKPMGMPAYKDWPQVMDQRDRALKAIEEARTGRGVDNPLDLGLRVTFSPKRHHYFEKVGNVDFADLCGVSRAEFVAGPEDQHDPAFEVLDLREEPRCERSWKRDGTVKQRSDGGWLTDRDAAAVGLG